MEDKTLLIVLEGIQNSQAKIVEIMGLMHTPMEANNLTRPELLRDPSKDYYASRTPSISAVLVHPIRASLLPPRILLAT